jgi:hypothetical protein
MNVTVFTSKDVNGEYHTKACDISVNFCNQKIDNYHLFQCPDVNCPSLCKLAKLRFTPHIFLDVPLSCQNFVQRCCSINT